MAESVNIVDYFNRKVLQVEGDFPRGVGHWLVTPLRLTFGWGLSIPVDFPSLNFPEALSPGRHPRNSFQSAYYQRVRNSTDCLRILRLTGADPPFVRAIGVGLEIGPEWAAPPGGILPLPDRLPPPMTSHVVGIVDSRLGEDRFVFQNSWRNWGNLGTGEMPFRYFNERFIESWASVFADLNLRTLARGASVQTIRQEVRSFWNEPIHVFVTYDPASDERLAWAFLLMRNDGFDVEELYVKPEYRGRGYGRGLSDQIRAFVKGKNRPVRLWVPFADCGSESPDNLAPLMRTVRRLGLYFHKCDVRWAAYLATSERGSEGPIEPDHVPMRPRSALEAVRAAALAAGMLTSGALGETGSENAPAVTINHRTDQGVAAVKPSSDELLAPFRRQVEQSGITDEELDGLFEVARDEVWRDRHEGGR